VGTFDVCGEMSLWKNEVQLLQVFFAALAMTDE